MDGNFLLQGKHNTTPQLVFISTWQKKLNNDNDFPGGQTNGLVENVH